MSSVDWAIDRRLLRATAAVRDEDFAGFRLSFVHVDLVRRVGG